MARTAIYKHTTQINPNVYPDDGTSVIGTTEWNEAPSASGMLGFTPSASTIAISSGALTITDSVCVATSESGTSDTIDIIAITNTNEYDVLYLFANTGHTITLTNTSSPSSNGQIRTVSNSNEILSSTSPTILIRKGNFWYGYGGGVVNAINDIGDVTISSVADNHLLTYDSASSQWTNQTATQAGFSASATTDTTNASNISSGTLPLARLSNITTTELSATAGITNGQLAGSIAQSKITDLTTDLAAKAPLASPAFTTEASLTAQAPLKLKDSDSSNFVAIRAPATVSSDVTWTLPNADGTNGQLLKTDGSGALSWASVGGGAPADSQFAPTTTTTGSTRIITDSEFTTPTSASLTPAGTKYYATTGAYVDTEWRMGNNTSWNFRIADSNFYNVVFTSFTLNIYKYNGSGTNNLNGYIKKVSDYSTLATATNPQSVTSMANWATASNLTFNFSNFTTPNEPFYIVFTVGVHNGDVGLMPSGERSGGDSVSYVTMGSLTAASGSSYPTYLPRISFNYGNLSDSNATNTISDKTNPTSNYGTNTTTNPSYYYQFTSTDLLGVAIHPHSSTNITSFRIDTATDTSSWVTRKTVPYSLLTHSQWNYIYIPRYPINVTKVRVVGLDASSKTFALNEFAIMSITDSEMSRRHRHVEYNPSTSCATLTGA